MHQEFYNFQKERIPNCLFILIFSTLCYGETYEFKEVYGRLGFRVSGPSPSINVIIF
jgi:hypothetical protein